MSSPLASTVPAKLMLVSRAMCASALMLAASDSLKFLFCLAESDSDTVY